MIIGVVISLITLSPVIQNFRKSPVDDFPLSYYPMFTKVRGKYTSLFHAIGKTEEGAVVNLPGKYLGVGGLNQVRKRASRMVKRGKGKKLCRRVARKVSKSKIYRNIQSVEIVRSRFEVSYETLKDPKPSQQKTHAECKVKRRSGKS